MHSDKLNLVNAQKKASDYSFTRTNPTGETHPACILEITLTTDNCTIAYKLAGKRRQTKKGQTWMYPTKRITFTYKTKQFEGLPMNQTQRNELKSLITTHLRTVRRTLAGPNQTTAALENVLLWFAND